MIVYSKNAFRISLFLQCYCLFLVLGYTDDRYYDRKYDFFDIDTLVQNPRLLRKYMDCFLNRGPCTPIGRVFKEVLPEIVATSCSKCTPAQRSFARRTFDAFKRHFPEHHEELKKLLDPENKKYDTFEKAIAKA